MSGDWHIEAAEARESRIAYVETLAARRAKFAREALENLANPTVALQEMRTIIKNTPDEAWKDTLSRIAARRTKGIEAQLASASAQLADAQARLREANSQLALSMAWGSALSSREVVSVAPAAGFLSQTTGDPWTECPAVYFVLNEGTGLVKVGRIGGSTDNRLKSSLMTRIKDFLVSGGGGRPRVLALLRGDLATEARATEAEWHTRFSGRRVLGEWFRLEPSDIPLTDFNTATINKVRMDRSARACARCGVTFSAKSSRGMRCGSQKCRSGYRPKPIDAEALRASYPAKGIISIPTPEGFAVGLAAAGRSLADGVADVICVRLGESIPHRRTKGRGVDTVAKSGVATIRVTEPMWHKMIDAAVSAGCRTPQKWAAAVLAESAQAKAA